MLGALAIWGSGGGVYVERSFGEDGHMQGMSSRSRQHILLFFSLYHG